MFKTSRIPYHYYRIAIASALILGTLSGMAQDSSRTRHSKDTAFGKIDTLKAAIVTATLRPRLKADTLEYNTENISIRKNAVVEELLRRLPGLQIDMNGNITYNGEKIQHLLVNGEDIFGSDPTLVTRNFNADKIAKVQILDRRSDQSIFTGIDDGTRTKTINLVLKQSARDGYFGKVDAGGNTGGYYNGDLALAGFRDKEQFTVLGFASNTGTLGFNTGAVSDAGVRFLNGNMDALGATAGTGVPRFTALALHYANNWDEQAGHLVANYQYSHYLTSPVTTTETLETLPASIYGQYQQSRSTNQQVQHWGYINYEFNLDRRSAVRLVFSESNSQGQNELGSTSRSSLNDILSNVGRRTITDKVSRNYIDGSISWRWSPGKDPNRVLSASINMGEQDVGTRGYLNSVNQFYLPTGGLQSIDTVDQRKEITSSLFIVGGTLSYKEPLWKGAFLGVNYSLSSTRDQPVQATFDRGNGKYQELVDSLSSYQQTRTIVQHLTFSIQGKIAGLIYTVGADRLEYLYRQKDLNTDSLLRLHYFTWTPRAMLIYTLNSTTSLQFTYNGTTQQPTASQLQPAINNNDPLHLTIGNPDLRPSTTHLFQANVRWVRSWLLNLGVGASIINNKISTRTTTDSLGRQVSQLVNVKGGRVASINLSVNKKLLGLDLGFHGNENYLRDMSYINGNLSRNDGYTTAGGFSINKFVADRFDLSINTNFSYFTQTSSVNVAAPVHYWSQSHSAALNIYLFHNYMLGTSANYTWQGRANALSQNTSVFLWSGALSRNLLSDILELKFSLNNILNANSGVTRSNINNINTQTTTNILGRYWMLSAIYHFDKKFTRK